MNREGKSYRSSRTDNGIVNGSIVLVTCSEKWTPALTDDQSNYTHICLVLACPQKPSEVGREVRLDERKYYTHAGVHCSTWSSDDGYSEI